MELTYKNYRAVSEGDRFNLYRMVEVEQVVVMLKATYEAKDGQIYPCYEYNGKWYAPKQTLKEKGDIK